MTMPTEYLTTELLTELVKEGGRSTFLEVHATELAAEVVRLRQECTTGAGLTLELVLERDAARKEADDLRKQLAAHTDPSPEAQLRRYREAQALVAKPPSIAEAWTDHGAAKVRRANGKILAAQTKEGGKISLSLDGYWDTTVSGATLADLDKLLTAAGWQLCGGGE